MIECHSSASKSPWHDYVIHELKMTPTIEATLKLVNKLSNTPEIPLNQKHDRRARVCLKFTIVLYLIPSKRARSLSTLIALKVRMETPHKMKSKAFAMFIRQYWISKFIFITALSRIVTKRGCDISPTQRSVTAKFPNSSFVGE